MKVGIIDNYDSFVYNLVRYIREYPNTEVIVQRNTEIDFAELETCDLLLLSPGPGIPSEAGDLTKVIETFHKTKSILGVCLGHQALGEFFGGSLVPSPQPVHGKSSMMNTANETTLFSNLESEIEIGRYHSWEVTLKEENVLTITGKVNDSIMAFQHQTLPIFGVQFHPESILTPYGRTIINNWLSTAK